VSYKSVFASDGCSAIGSTIYNTIVPIPGTEQLSSAFGGTLPCVAHVQNAFTQEFTATASFNVNDLIEPVPFSIYSSQPWCATYQFEHGCNKECPTTEAYKPIIVVPEVVLQNMDPAWASCYGDIRGVYDPPIALTQVASVKGSQITASVPTTSEVIGATPASSPSHPAAETIGAIVDPGSLSSNSVAASAPHSSPRSSQGHGGIDIATALPDDLHSSNADDDVAPHASEFSDSGPSIGDAVADILGGADDSNEEDTSPSNGVSSASSDAVNSGPQAPHLFQSSQSVGGIIAAILGGAGPSSAASTSVSSFVSKGQSENNWNSLSTLRTDSESWANRGSDLIQESGQAHEFPTTRQPEGQASKMSEFPLTRTEASDSGSFSGLPSRASTTTPDNESRATNLIATQGSMTDARASAYDTSSVAAGVSKATASCSDDVFVICSMLILMIASVL
jgi:hypothetical protein